MSGVIRKLIVNLPLLLTRTLSLSLTHTHTLSLTLPLFCVQTHTLSISRTVSLSLSLSLSLLNATDFHFLLRYLSTNRRSWYQDSAYWLFWKQAHLFMAAFLPFEDSDCLKFRVHLSSQELFRLVVFCKSSNNLRDRSGDYCWLSFKSPVSLL